jgi:hypothetical protein
VAYVLVAVVTAIAWVAQSKPHDKLESVEIGAAFCGAFWPVALAFLLIFAPLVGLARLATWVTGFKGKE